MLDKSGKTYCSSLLLQGRIWAVIHPGAFWMASTFSGVGWTPSAEMRCPRYSTDGRTKEHFFRLSLIPDSSSRVRTEVAEVLLSLLASDQNVVDIDRHSRLALENVLDNSLEQWGSGRNSERQIVDSVEPLVCVNGDHLLCLIIKDHLLVCICSRSGLEMPSLPRVKTTDLQLWVAGKSLSLSCGSLWPCSHHQGCCNYCFPVINYDYNY